MFGIGGVELLVLIAIAVVLFGAPVLTFLAGYALGRKRAELPAADADANQLTPSDTSEEQHPDA